MGVGVGDGQRPCQKRCWKVRRSAVICILSVSLFDTSMYMYDSLVLVPAREAVGMHARQHGACFRLTSERSPRLSACDAYCAHHNGWRQWVVRCSIVRPGEKSDSGPGCHGTPAGHRGGSAKNLPRGQGRAQAGGGRALGMRAAGGRAGWGCGRRGGEPVEDAGGGGGEPVGDASRSVM